jgi:catechol 2,3-dioxygenase
MRHVTLRVADLDRSLRFYTQQLGFHAAATDPAAADLSVAPGAPALLRLVPTRSPAADPAAAGLFHAALLLPSRAALGAWLGFAAAREVKFQGFSDHAVSEALYLADPDGNGLEFYCDRPRDVWPFAANGEVAMTTRALDVRALLATASPPLPPAPLAGAHWGHLHLRVVDLAASTAYYRAQLGLDITQSSYPGARFLARDGYHHHVALNTWSRARHAPAPDAPGLAAATFADPGLAAPSTAETPEGYTLHRVLASAA